MFGQAPVHVLLVRPHHFRPNPLTAVDNAFQHPPVGGPGLVAALARAEVDALAETLAGAGVGVRVVEDEGTATPDSIFPNNWFSTHADGTVVLYPMCAPNRRAERRADVIEDLRERFTVRRLLDLSAHEREGRFLEGTGAMVIDHLGGVAYACRSRRLDSGLFALACQELGLRPLLVEASDAQGMPVYHTNVLMSVGTEVALVGSSMIRDPVDRARLLSALSESGRDVVELTEEQVRGFAGNSLEVAGRSGRVLVMSRRAERLLTPAQRRRIEASCPILSVPAPTIEAAGGSVRCMIAGIHLPLRARPGLVASLPGPGYRQLTCDTSDDEVDRERGETVPAGP